MVDIVFKKKGKGDVSFLEVSKELEKKIIDLVFDEFDDNRQNKETVCSVKPCRSNKFEGISCLEMENEVGFFRSDVDVRPSSAIWIDKDDAKRLYFLFRKDLLVGE